MLSDYLRKDALLGRFFDVFHCRRFLFYPLYRKNGYRYSRYDKSLCCVEYGLPEPEFKMRDGFVTIIYRKKGLAFEKVNEKGTEKDTIEDIVEKNSEKSSEKIVNVIKGNPLVTIEELSVSLNKTTRAIEKNIAKLKAEGMLERIGPDKGGYWKVKNQQA